VLISAPRTRRSARPLGRIASGGCGRGDPAVRQGERLPTSAARQRVIARLVGDGGSRQEMAGVRQRRTERGVIVRGMASRQPFWPFAPRPIDPGELYAALASACLYC
jgi:hypothetical protein